MAFPVVKVHKDEFDQFLLDSKDVATLWNPDNMNFEQFVTGLPCEVHELRTAIDLFGGDNDYVYIFNSNLEDPDKGWGEVTYSDEALPEVKSSELSDYVVRSSLGKDFLYFACSLEEASNQQYTTLLPGGFLEGDDADEEEDDLD